MIDDAEHAGGDAEVRRDPRNPPVCDREDGHDDGDGKLPDDADQGCGRTPSTIPPFEVPGGQSAMELVNEEDMCAGLLDRVTQVWPIPFELSTGNVKDSDSGIATVMI